MVLKTKPLTRHLDTDTSVVQPLILAENMGIKYEGEKERSGDFKSMVHRFFTYNKEEKYEVIWALKDVNFAGYPGEVLGVIGPNGAGKTTLCRAVLGLLKPDKGRIQVRGKVTSMLSLGTGFNNELSGRENINLNGLMMGLSRNQLNKLLPSIEEFTGLGRFLDYPLKFYSTGMRARLGFSIAAALEPEILVIDEVLGTGDLEFKDRAVERMHEIVSGAKMVVVVTHDTDFVEDNCTRALWLDKGRVVALGDPEEITTVYREEVAERIMTKNKKIVNIRETHTEAGNKKTIKVNNLGVKFKLGKESFWALKDISFSVREKEILGVIGRNGAGKTTLCRTLCGLYRPDRGLVKIEGNITALLSFRLGFNEQLSGYDNIYLNGMMLGMSKKIIQEMERNIIEFAELEKEIHSPVKEYSSGMKSRLGFSIAAMLRPDIFVVDETLSAGDMAFREKATSRMQEMLEEAKTVVLVTHNLGIVEKVCTRAIWIHEGKLRYCGDPKEVVAFYRESVKQYQNMKKALSVKQDARLQQAVEAFGNGNYQIAEALFKEVLRESPKDIVVLSQYAEIAEVRNKWYIAKKRWLKVLQAAEDSGEVPYKIARKRLNIIREKLATKQL